MERFHKPEYKVHRSPEKGMYYVTMPKTNPVYIRKVVIGSRAYYKMSNTAYFPTLRDAIFAIVG